MKLFADEEKSSDLDTRPQKSVHWSTDSRPSGILFCPYISLILSYELYVTLFKLLLNIPGYTVLDGTT